MRTLNCNQLLGSSHIVGKLALYTRFATHSRPPFCQRVSATFRSEKRADSRVPNATISQRPGWVDRGTTGIHVPSTIMMEHIYSCRARGCGVTFFGTSAQNHAQSIVQIANLANITTQIWFLADIRGHWWPVVGGVGPNSWPLVAGSPPPDSRPRMGPRWNGNNEIMELMK